MARLIADQNGDGAVNPSDYFAFVANYTAGDMTADANQDGELTPADYSAWFAAYQRGEDGPVFNEEPDTDEPWASSIPADFTDYEVVYVDSADGSDAQSGTLALPVQTLAKGLSLANSKAGNGKPVALLLKSGGSYSGRIRDAEFMGGVDGRPGCLGIYGGATRATVTATDSGFWRVINSTNNKDNLRNSVIFGIEFLPQSNNSGKCLEWLKGTIDGVIIENCVFRNFKEAIVFQKTSGGGAPKNLALRRCVVKDNKVPGVRGRSSDNSSGLFAQNIDGLVIEQCVFDNNGDQSQYSHGIYLRGAITNFVMINSIVTRSGSTGLQARNGGIIRDNIFADNSIGILTAGDEAIVERNVVVGMNDISDGERRGWGIDWENSYGYTVIKDNIIGASNSAGSDTRGIRFSGKDGPSIFGLIKGNYITQVAKPISTGAQNDEEHDIAQIQITGNFIRTTGATTDALVGTWPNAFVRNGPGTPNPNNVTVSGNSVMPQTLTGIGTTVPNFYTTLASDPFSLTAQTRTIYATYKLQATFEGEPE